MDYEVRMESGFLRITDSRSVTAGTVMRFCVEVPKIARESGVSKILVDHRDVPNTLSAVDRFQFAAQVAEHFRGLKVAFVQAAPLRDPQLFGETVALNRGANIRLCTTLEEAYDWLEVDPANMPDRDDAKGPQ